MKVAENILNQDFNPNEPDKLLVVEMRSSALQGIQTAKGWL